MTMQARGQRIDVRRVLAALVATCAISGCARRVALTPEELARVEARADVEALRVYPGRRVVLLHRQLVADVRYRVRRSISESSRGRPIREILSRHAAGKIVARDKLRGATRLWVSFSPDCQTIACAFAFVETAQGSYLLAAVPGQPGRAPPEVYRGIVTRGRRVLAGRAHSLAEPNAVYLRERLIGGIEGIELVVRKRNTTRGAASVQFTSGYD